MQVKEVLNKEIYLAAESIQFSSDSFFSSTGLQTLKDFNNDIGNIDFDGKFHIHISVLSLQHMHSFFPSLFLLLLSLSLVLTPFLHSPIPLFVCLSSLTLCPLFPHPLSLSPLSLSAPSPTPLLSLLCPLPPPHPFSLAFLVEAPILGFNVSAVVHNLTVYNATVNETVQPEVNQLISDILEVSWMAQHIDAKAVRTYYLQIIFVLRL